MQEGPVNNDTMQDITQPAEPPTSRRKPAKCTQGVASTPQPVAERTEVGPHMLCFRVWHRIVINALQGGSYKL